MALKKPMNAPQRLSLAGAILVLCICLPPGVLTGVKADKNPKPEEIVERTILAYGSRAALYAIQRNGTQRALIKFFTPEGVREGKSVTKFIRKEKLVDDLLMIELELP